MRSGFYPGLWSVLNSEKPMWAWFYGGTGSMQSELAFGDASLGITVYIGLI